MIKSASSHTRTARKPIVSSEEVKAISSTLKIKYGIDFTNYEMSSLTRGLNRVLLKHKMSSTLDLWSRLLQDRSFLTTFIDDMTVNLTELFRNPDFWEEIVSIISSFYAIRPFNVWHAGCSSGEEVYTMSIVLHQLGVQNRGRLTGTDLSTKMLAKAEEGDYKVQSNKYKDSLLKVFPDMDLNKYFNLDDEAFHVRSNLKRNIQFFQQNLVTEKAPGSFDLIFCRNVMIYFDDDLKMQVMKKFYDALADDGYFIIGYYDMMPTGYEQYFTLFNPRCRIYKKNA